MVNTRDVKVFIISLRLSTPICLIVMFMNQIFSNIRIPFDAESNICNEVMVNL